MIRISIQLPKLHGKAGTDTYTVGIYNIGPRDYTHPPKETGVFLYEVTLTPPDQGDPQVLGQFEMERVEGQWVETVTKAMELVRDCLNTQPVITERS